MPLILVVDRDERVPKRVRQSLGSEGWTVTHVRDVTEALQSAGSEAPDLFLVASELPSARNLLGTFARRQGGPGTLALVPDQGAATAGGAGLGEDAVLGRSFDDGQLRDAVERILRTPDRPARPAGDEPKLTSQDIFGDLVAEVERETGVSEPVPPKPPPRPVVPAGPPAAARQRAIDDDIERKLEQTLSGVLGMSLGAKPSPERPSAKAPRTPSRPSDTRPAGGRADDLDKLISDTLSGLDLPGSGPRKRRAAPGAPAGEGAPGRSKGKPEPPGFGLADLEALVGRPRKAPSRPGPAPAPPPAPAAAAAEPQEEPEDRGPLPFGSLFAEAMQEVPEAEADQGVGESAVPPTGGHGGREFGQYHLLDRIGVGGMAEVWKARMRGVEGFQKTVAIKRILPHLTDSPDFVEMFVDEAKLAAQLNHANIIHIYDLGKLGDDYYIAMEYVEGENLREILNRARERELALPPGIALYIGARLASALDYAHRKRDFEDRELGLVHRDVSPQNVLVGYEGTIKLCDFGIVKAVSKSSHTQMGALKGKLQYMSPEQAWGRALDGRSDIFAVGCLLFEMVTGRRLFVGESELEVLEAVRECRVQAPTELQPDLDSAIDDVVLKALARDPELRFQTAGELERRLEEILASVRPAPGQSGLASFMARLFDRAPVVPSAEADRAAAATPGPVAGRPPEPAEEAASVAASGSGPAPAPVPDRKPETPGAEGSEEPVPGEPATAAGEAQVEAVAPVRDVEPEEGGRRGKWLLVAAIVVAVALGGLLAWYLLERGGTDDAIEQEPPAPVEEEVAPPPASRAAVGEGAPEDPAGGAEPGTEVGSPTTGEVTPPDEPDAPDELTETIDRAVEEGLARREEILRKQFEEEERRLQRQLEALQKSAREEEADAAGEGAAADESPPPDPEPEPPPAPPPAPPEPRPQPAARGAPQAEPLPAAAVSRTPARPSPRPPSPPPPSPPPPKPEPSVRPGELVTLGPGVRPPKLVRFEKPEYPPIARRLRKEGVVVVSVLVAETGSVLDTRLVQSAGRDVGLEEAALEAARGAEFEPATKEGVRVKMWTTLRIPFKL